MRERERSGGRREQGPHPGKTMGMLPLSVGGPGGRQGRSLWDSPWVSAGPAAPRLTCTPRRPARATSQPRAGSGLPASQRQRGTRTSCSHQHRCLAVTGRPCGMQSSEGTLGKDGVRQGRLPWGLSTQSSWPAAWSPHPWMTAAPQLGLLWPLLPCPPPAGSEQEQDADTRKRPHFTRRCPTWVHRRDPADKGHPAGTRHFSDGCNADGRLPAARLPSLPAH